MSTEGIEQIQKLSPQEFVSKYISFEGKAFEGSVKEGTWRPTRELNEFNERNNKIKEKVEERIKSDFPTRTFFECAGEKIYHDKSSQSSALVPLAKCFKWGQLDAEDPVGDIKRLLQGKRVLVLGDDVGSLSEILNTYGAEAYGVEIVDMSVSDAHSGKYAEGGKPQKQVIKGDMVKGIVGEYPHLLSKLRKLGPFDAIVSLRVFNSAGGGGQQGRLEYGLPSSYSNGRFFERSQSLLNKDGFQLHLEVDMILNNARHADEKAYIPKGSGAVFVRNSAVAEYDDGKVVWTSTGEPVD